MTTPLESPRTDALLKTGTNAEQLCEALDRSRKIEIELGEALATINEMAHNHVKKAIECLDNRLELEQQNTSLLAQIAVKNEALKDSINEYILYRDKFGLSGNQNLQLGRLQAALTSSPAAAKELLEQNERMKVALESISVTQCRQGDTPFIVERMFHNLAKEALSTTQPAKG